MGCSPKYCVNELYKLPYIGFAFCMAVSLWLKGTDAPPLKLGTSRVRVSPMPLAPSGDIVTVQSRRWSAWRFLPLHQFAFTAHGFLAVSIGVIEVRQIGGHDKGSHYQHGACLEESGQRLVAPCVLQISTDEEQDDEEEIVGHLYVVGVTCKATNSAVTMPPANSLPR